MSKAYDVITSRIVELLESGVVPWQKPWSTPGRSAVPKNCVSGREYRGINVWMLFASRYSSPYRLSYRQALASGGHVRSGEKVMPVVFWKIGAREVQDGDEVCLKQSFLCRYYTVFNVEQCEGIAAPKLPAVPPRLEPIQACEGIIQGWPARPQILHGSITPATANGKT